MARLQLYKRGKVWWIDGSVDGNRIRESTRETDKKRAEQIAAKREREVHNTSVFGPESVLTFGTATGIYLDAGKSDRYLTPIFEKWEHRLVREIKPGNIHDLCRELYPKAGPATMNRQVISPVQAIINHSAKRGLCAPIRVERFFVPKHKPKYATMQWLEAFMSAARSSRGAGLYRCRIGEVWEQVIEIGDMTPPELRFIADLIEVAVNEDEANRP